MRSDRIFVGLLLLSTVATNTCADWPAFLGGDRRDEASNYEPPTRWSPEQIAWQTKLAGHGQSSPVVVGNRVYLTSVQGPMKETNLVSCFDLGTGQRLWQREFESSLKVKNDTYTSRAAPTPAADSAGVYAFFESGNLVALTPDGEVRWQRDFIADYGKYEGRFGLGASLAQLDDRVFVLADNEAPAYLLAVDKQSGETLWKTDRTSRTAWSSPTIVPVDGEPQVVVSAAGSVNGYSPETGQLLWSYEDVGGNTVASPVVAGDGQFLIGASPGRGGESSEGARKSNLLMKVEPTDQGFRPSVVWRNEQATSSFGSPIAYQGHAYYTNRAGVLFCLDLETGETVYTTRLEESNWATPIGIGNHIFFFGKGGVTTVIKSGNEEHVVATNRLWNAAADSSEQGQFAGETVYGVAALPRGFLVRTGSRLIRIGRL